LEENNLITLIICCIGIQGVLFPQDPGEINSAELMETKTAEQIIFELETDFSEFDIPLDITYDVSLYRVEYHTIDPQNVPTIASGVLAVPLTPQFNPRPLFSFQHGTVLKRSSVASVQGFDVLSMWLGGRGFITAIPDLLGLGVSEMLHPYMVYIPSATAVVDMIRASHNLCDSLEIGISGQTFLSGYSEGGYVTMAAHKYIESELSDEIQITASAPCAGPYDLSAVMLDLMLTPEPYNSPFYLPYTVLAYNDVYELYDSPSEFFISPYDTLLPPMFDGYHSGGEVDAVMPEIPIEIILPELVDEVSSNSNHPLRIALQENDVYPWVPQSPVALLHSNQDDLVPVQNTLNTYEYFISHGAENIEMYVDDLGGHVEAAGILLLAAAAWIEEFLISSMDISFDYGWNMMGISLISENNSVEILFPESVENSLFSYSGGGYVEETQLIPGTGYWLRFNSEGFVSPSGELIEELTLTVNEGWNLISGISFSVAVAEIESELIIEGSVFGYNGEYYEPQFLEPGKAYWLRCTDNGTISISIIP
jgi:hypothetical protein